MKINNKLFIAIIFLSFMVGIIAGIPLGMKAQQNMFYYGVGVMLEDSNINFTIDINETILIEGFRDKIIPVLNQTFQMNKNCSGETC